VGRKTPLVAHHHFLLLLHAVVHAVVVMLVAVLLAVVSEVRRLADAGVLLGQQVVQLDVERRHRRQFLQHLRQQFLEMLLSLLLLGRKLLCLGGRVEDWAQEIDDVVLLLVVLVEALEEISLVVAFEKAFDLVHGSLWQLRHKLFPVSMLYFEKAH